MSFCAEIHGPAKAIVIVLTILAACESVDAAAALFPSSTAVLPSAGSSSFSLAMSPAAAWTASSSAAWLTVGLASGSGDSVVTYQWTANTSPLARQAQIAIAGQSFVVNQLGSAGASTAWGTVSPGQVVTIAGTGVYGNTGNGVPATTALFEAIDDVKVDANGNVYICDSGNNRVRRVDASTGLISTVAGNGTSGFSGDGGLAISASLNGPVAIALDAAGDIFIADAGYFRIRRVDAVSGVITTVAGSGSSSYSGDGGSALAAGFAGIAGLAVDGSGNLYISDMSNRVRRVDAVTGIITTVAGNGTSGFSGDGGAATSANLYGPLGLAVDHAGNLFIADSVNTRIRRVDAVTGFISTFAGGGSVDGQTADGGAAVLAALGAPRYVAVDQTGNVYISETYNADVREVSASTGIITTPFPDEDNAQSLSGPLGLAIDGAGSLYVTDPGNYRVRFMDQVSPQIAATPVVAILGAASGSSSVAFTISPSNAPWVASASGAWLTLTSATSGSGGASISYSYAANSSVGPRNGTISINGQVVEVIQSGAVLTLSPNSAVIPAAGSSGTFNVTVTPAAAWSAVSSAAWLTVSPRNGSGNATVMWTATPNGNANARTAIITVGGQTFAVLETGTTVSYTSWGGTANGNIRTIAGQATSGFGMDNIAAIQSYLSGVNALAVDANNDVFIADANRVRRVDALTGIITTVAGIAAGATGDGYYGDGGLATSALLNQPHGLAVVGGNLYIADTGNQRIRMVDAAGYISTVAGTGVMSYGGDGGPATGAMLNTPRGIAADAYGNLYIADVGNARVRRIDAVTGTISTVAGNGMPGFSGDNGPAVAAQFNYPNAVATDGNGNIFVADVYNGRIRRVDAVSGQITTVAGDGILGGSFSNGSSALLVSMGNPAAVSVTSTGDLIVLDGYTPRILRVDTQGIVTTINSTTYTGNNPVLNNVPALTAPILSNGIAVDGSGDVYLINGAHVDAIDFSTPAVTLSVSNAAPGPVASTGSVNLSITPANAMWLATSSATWLTIANPTGSGSATINYSLSANNSFVARSAAITIAGITLTVIQAGATASLSSNSVTVGAAAGSSTVSLTVTPAVPWTAVSSAAWLTVSAGNGNGSTSFSYSWAANTTGSARMATIVVAGQYFSVLQMSAAEGYFPWAAASSYGMIRTVAGNGGFTPLGDGGPALSAALLPGKTVVDANGNLYIADSSNYRVRRVDVNTGLISTVAGNGTPYGENEGGPATSAALRPLGIALDAAGNLFIADNQFARIRRVDAVTGIITSVAGGVGGVIGDGGLAVNTTLYGPTDVAVDGNGVLYIADGSTVRRVDPVTGIISTLAGAPYATGTVTPNGDGGPATQASLARAAAIALDATGDIFVDDNGTIRKISAATGIITTVAGGGSSTAADGVLATSANLNATSVAADAAGDFFLTSGKVLRVDAVSGAIAIMAGNGGCCNTSNGDGGPATLAQFQSLAGVALDGSGNLYISDYTRVRAVDLATPQITLGSTSAQIGAAAGTGSTSITVAPAGALWVGASTAPWLTLTTPSGAGSGTLSYSFTANTGFEPRIGTIGVYGQMLVVTQAGAVASISPGSAAVTAAGGTGSIALTATAGITWQATSAASWVTVSPPSGSGNATVGYTFAANISQSGRSAVLTIAGQAFTITQLGTSGNYSPWAASVNGQINTIAGNGTAGFAGDGAAALLAELNQPHGIAVDGTGAVYFADTTNNRIRRVDPVSHVISTVAGVSTAGFGGDGGLATAASFSQPNGIALDSSGNLYIADVGNNRIRRIDAVTGFASTVAGNGATGTAGVGGSATAANLNGPAGVVADAAGNLFISDTNNNRILRVDGVTGILLPWAGTGVAGDSGDGGSALLATLSLPTGIAIDAAGNLYFSDSGNRTIRRVDAAAGTISTIAGGGSCCSLPTDGIAATLAQLSNPAGIQVDGAGNVYFADTGSSRVRRVDAVTGIITTAAGNGVGFYATGDGGPATQAGVPSPTGIAITVDGLYIADYTSRIRFVDLGTPQVTLSPAATSLGVSAGTGSVSISVIPVASPWVASSNAAWLSLTTTGGTGNGAIGYTFTDNNTTSPRLGVISVYGQTADVVQAGAVSALSSTSAVVAATAGSGMVSVTTGAAVAWTVTSSASWLTVGTAGGTGGGTITWNYTANTSVNARQAVLQIAGKVFSVLQLGTTGNYTAWGASSYGVIRSLTSAAVVPAQIVQGVAVDSNDNVYFSQPYGYVVEQFNSVTGILSTVAGNGYCCFPYDMIPSAIPATSAEFQDPRDVAVDLAGNLFFIEASVTPSIRRVDAVTGLVTTVPNTTTSSIAVDTLGNLYFTNQATNTIQVLNALTGQVSTVAGSGVAGFSGDGGPATQATLNNPTSVAADASGNLFIGDSGNFRVRRVDAITGFISTVAGSGAQGFAGDGAAATSASFGTYLTVAVDPGGNVFVCDGTNYRIRRIDSESGIITTVVGTGSPGFIGDGDMATSASINGADEMAFDGAGNLYFDDIGNFRIRFVDFSTPRVTQAIAPPTSDSVNPNALSGTSQTFTVNYSSAGGFGNLQIVEALINSRIDGRYSCYVFYVQATNSLYLANTADTGTTGPLAPGASATLQNNSCVLSGAGSSVSGSGNTLSLTLSVSFLPGIAGAENVYGLAKDNAGQDSGWIDLGTWTIPQTLQTISFATLANVAVGSQSFALIATASSGLAVTFTSNTPSVCSMNNIYVNILSAGGCSITASQSGSTGYLAAAPVTQTFTVLFSDVSPTDIFYNEVNVFAQLGITNGCGNNDFCPTASVTRDEMAIFIVRAIYGSDNFTYTTTPYFTDVTPSTFGFQWIQKLKDLGITSGCTATTYCPTEVVTRDQMAIFVIRARLGVNIAGPTPTFTYPSTPYFTDATVSNEFAFPWIQRMRLENITSGCTATTFCSTDPVTREEMATFIMRGAFNQFLPAGTPLISQIGPATLPVGTSGTFTITGVNTNFVQGTTVLSPIPGVTIGTVTVTGATSLTVQLTAASNAVAQPYSVLAITGNEQDVLPNGLVLQ